MTNHNSKGVTLLEMMIVVLLISIIAAVVIPKLTESKTSANETSAIATLKVLATAQAQFREADRENDTYLDYSSALTELCTVGLIDNVIGGGMKSGYVFALSGATYKWECTATPVNERVAKRSFYIATSGTIRYSLQGTPDANSPPVGE